MSREPLTPADRQVERQVAAAFADVGVPASLQARLDAGKPRTRTRTRLALPAIAFAALLAALLFRSLPTPPDQPLAAADAALPEALVSEFETFIVSGRGFDITSSNAATLSAWFTSRLNTSPPPDPPIEPTLTLAGGRLCQILKHRVASYVYKLGDTPISLYINRAAANADTAARPATNTQTNAAPGNTTPRVQRLTLSTQNGFAYATWNQGVWQYSLVAALPTQKIAEIATLLSARLAEQSAEPS